MSEPAPARRRRRAGPATGRHVVLVGLMGTGKSTVGRLLADRLGWRLVDSDTEIEALTGRTVREIFATDGEPAFRELETQALATALLAPEPSVIAAAGGVVLAEKNRRALRRSGADVVWLTADLAVLVGRATAGTHRPLLDDDPAGVLAAMATDREPLYTEVATARIDTTRRRPDAIVDEILSRTGVGT